MITVPLDAEDDEYAWIAVPSELGEPTFWFNGFCGGFVREASVAVGSGAVQTNVYRSMNPGLGRIDVEIR